MDSVEGEEEARSKSVQPKEEEDIKLALWVRSLVDTEGIFESPIDINLSQATRVQCPLINWVNHEVPPKKMKLTNTGHTLILSARWRQERPFLTKGPLLGNYVFSQLHLHWGVNDMEGSEHTIDGSHLPGEMHVVLFKSAYSTQESALRHKDGIVTLVYMLKLQDGDNPYFQSIIDNVPKVQSVNTVIRINPFDISPLVQKFDSDYFLYWGSIETLPCVHFVLWLITRRPLGVSLDQLESLRSLFDVNDNILVGNVRPVQPRQSRQLLLINPSPSMYSTLLKQQNCEYIRVFP